MREKTHTLSPPPRFAPAPREGAPGAVASLILASALATHGSSFAFSCRETYSNSEKTPRLSIALRSRFRSESSRGKRVCRACVERVSWAGRFGRRHIYIRPRLHLRRVLPAAKKKRRQSAGGSRVDAAARNRGRSTRWFNGNGLWVMHVPGTVNESVSRRTDRVHLSNCRSRRCFPRLAVFALLCLDFWGGGMVGRISMFYRIRGIN